MSVLNWGLSEAIFDNEARLREAERIILSLGDSCEILTGHPLINTPKSKHFDIVLGTLGWANKLGFYDKSLYTPQKYMQFNTGHYLNSQCIFTPLHFLKNKDRLEHIVQSLGIEDKIFIKPNSGFKLFTGFSSSMDSLPHELSLLNVDESELLLVSKHVDIGREFRFFIVDNEIVTDSEYSWGEVEHGSVPSPYMSFAKLLLREFKDLGTYTLDLAVPEGSLFPKIVEVNNIYTSGTYSCDLNRLIVSLRDKYLKDSNSD